MANKTFSVKAKMDDGFTMVSKLGNHTVYVDQPKGGGGNDLGPNPIQYFMLSLSGCIGTVAKIVANERNIELRSIELELEGDLDTDKLLGVDKDKRAGLGEIKVVAEIDADMTPEQKEEFLEEVKERCPVSDNISNETKISLSVN